MTSNLREEASFKLIAFYLLNNNNNRKTQINLLATIKIHRMRLSYEMKCNF